MQTNKPSDSIDAAKEGLVNATDPELLELAQADPVAAVMAGMPHRLRNLVEFTMRELKSPSVRYEHSDAEKRAGLPARAIKRDIKHHVKFLRSNFYPTGMKRDPEYPKAQQRPVDESAE